MFTLSLEGLRPRRAFFRPPRPIHFLIPFSDLCALCVSAFSSPSLSPFNFKLLALSGTPVSLSVM
jgi:hypothetical protein